jgi:hypothetical protein
MNRGERIASILTGSWRAAPPGMELSELELGELYSSLVGSGIGGLAWRQIRQSRTRSMTLATNLRDVYRSQALQEAVCERKLGQAFTYMRDAGIEPVLFKGWAIARFYPEPGLRPLGDIDLFVAPDLEETAKRAVVSWSLGPSDVDFSHEELDMLGLPWHEVFAHSEQVKLEETDIRVMGPEHQLALLCMHFLKHGGWRPLWLCDIAVALESRLPTFDWDLCLGSDRRKSHWIACTLGVAHILLGADIADTPVAHQAERLPRWLVPAVLRAWERPQLVEHTVPELITTSLRHPMSLPRALQTRWLNPIEGTVRVGGTFNELPRLPYQIANYVVQVQRFAARLVKAVRRL